MKQVALTLDEALQPMSMGCAKCGGQMVVYPCHLPKGTGYCPNCSPIWLKGFATWQMNQERTGRGLNTLEV